MGDGLDCFFFVCQGPLCRYLDLVVISILGSRAQYIRATKHHLIPTRPRPYGLPNTDKYLSPTRFESARLCWETNSKPTQATKHTLRSHLDPAILHETVHEMRRKKLNGVILKLDFEKAYGKVKWSFLQQTLTMKGFSEEWCAWVYNFVIGGSMAIKANNYIRHYFQKKD